MVDPTILVKASAWHDTLAAMKAANNGQLSHIKAQRLLDAYFGLIEGARKVNHPATPETGI